MSVNLSINGLTVTAREGATILEAASEAGIHIPTLCFLKDCNKVAACRMCVVEVKGARTLMPSCSAKVQGGMEVQTDTPMVRKSRRHTMDLIFRHHNTKCEYCARYSDCELHAMLRSMGMNEHDYETGQRACPDDSTKAIVRDNSKCITCRRCVSACGNVQGVGVLKAFRSGGETYISSEGPLADSDCTRCGACIQACPTGALSVYSEMEKVAFALRNKRGRKLAAVIAPEAAEKLGSVFYDEGGERGKLNSALRLLGFDAVYDRAALGNAPYCPAVERYVKNRHPALGESLYGTAAKKPFAGLRSAAAKSLNVPEEQIFLVSISPCTGEKEEENGADVTLTTVETAELIRHQCVSRFTANEFWASLEPGAFDKSLETEEAQLGHVVSGLKAVEEALMKMENGDLRPDEVTLWACPGGCVNGGGQPRTLRSGL